jgi:hypothetical protein
MFENGRQQRGPSGSAAAGPAAPQTPSFSGYDDGRDSVQHGAVPLSPAEIVDEAALALALDPQDYRPWILQRGRARPATMLHLRRFEARSGLWTGWQLSYPYLVAVEYTGDTLLSLDFGARQFVVTGRGLGELVGHLQTGNVLTVTEYNGELWRAQPEGASITAIKCLGQNIPAIG